MQPKTPNVYVREKSILPPSVAEVATAIPAFIGYTEKTTDAEGNSLVDEPMRITSMGEFIALYGRAFSETFIVDENGYLLDVKDTNLLKDKNEEDLVCDGLTATDFANADQLPAYIMYQSVQHFFSNGGGACYIVSCGGYEKLDTTTNKMVPQTPSKADYKDALDKLALVDEVTLFVLTDAVTTLTSVDAQGIADSSNYYMLVQDAIAQCNDNLDRFALADVVMNPTNNFKALSKAEKTADIDAARTLLPGDKYAAAYYPYLETVMPRSYDDETVRVKGKWLKKNKEGKPLDSKGDETSSPKEYVYVEGIVTLEQLNGKIKRLADGTPEKDSNGKIIVDKTYLDTKVYNAVKAQLAKNYLVLPPTPAMAGIYAKTDKTRGVWKAPANVMVSSVLGPITPISNDEQAAMNVDGIAGKSVNAIRSFAGKGTLVWGARTLAGNDNEWRYISVRRLFNMVEESIQKATGFAVFEPNTPFTWLKLKTMMESYLTNLWKQGAFFGDSPAQAFFVNVGLGQTMTEDDINNGIMHIEIGLAAVRPAEFIILTFSHKRLEG